MPKKKTEVIWFPFYVDDYARDCNELSLVQHGAYLNLLRWYYSTGRPIPNEPDRIYRRIGAFSAEERTSTDYVLAEFFILDGPVWRHSRIDAELESVRHRSQNGRRAAIISVENRRIRADRMTSARKLGRHTKEDFETLKIVCGNRCVRCGSDGYLVEDHILPISQAGSDGIDNIQPLCDRCNSGKGGEVIDHRPKWWLEKFNEINENGSANAERTLSKPQPQPQPQPQPHLHLQTQSNSKAKAVSEVTLPDWMPKTAWLEYGKMRMRIRAPLTPYASNLLIGKIQKLRDQGHDPETMLNTAIERSWKSVYPSKSEDKGGNQFDDFVPLEFQGLDGKEVSHEED